MHAVFDGLKVPRNSISDSLTTYWISINDSVMSRDLIAVTPCHGLSHGIVHHADLSHTVSWNVKTWSPPRSPITRGREDIIRSLCSWCMALKPGGVRGEFSMKDAVWTRPGGSFLVSDDDESLTSTFSNLLLQAYESSDVWFAILCDVDRACRIPPDHCIACYARTELELATDISLRKYTYIDVGHKATAFNIPLQITLQYCSEKSHISVGGTTAQYSIRVGCFNETAKSMNLQSPAVNH